MSLTMYHDMLKCCRQVGIDVDTAPRQAGYIADNSSVLGTIAGLGFLRH